MKLLLIILFSLTLVGCPEKFNETPDNYFRIVNHSPERVYIDYDIQSHLEMNTTKPILFKLESNHSLREGIGYRYFIDKKLVIFIFRESVINKYTWKNIRDKGLYDKRYDLTLDDLRAMNWTIVYTGK